MDDATLYEDVPDEITSVNHWKLDIEEIKLEPMDEITIEDHTVELSKEIADCNLFDLINAPHDVILEDVEGPYNAAHHTSALPNSGMQLTPNVKSKLLPGGHIPSDPEYSRVTVTKRMCNIRHTSTVRRTENQTRPHETVKTNKLVLYHEVFNSSGLTLRCKDDKLNVCDTCHKCFSTVNNLRRHIKIHTGSKPHTCDTCHKCFRYLCNLKAHIIVHTKSKPYTCDTCHKCFRYVSNLKAHEQIHTKSKPYTCDTCHKRFRYLSNLKTHIKIHTKSKPYTCDICHKCFRQLFTLKRHAQVHTESKPYNCDICNKSFRQLSNLKRHTSRKHTGSKSYTDCDTCH